MAEIGVEVVKRLKIQPVRLVVEEHRYYTYACRTCEQEDIATPVVKAPREKNIIPGSFATPEAVAHIMTQKFVMGSPLYRQSRSCAVRVSSCPGKPCPTGSCGQRRII